MECCSGISNLLSTIFYPSGTNWRWWWHLAPLGQRNLSCRCVRAESSMSAGSGFTESDKRISAGSAVSLQQETDLNSQQSIHPPTGIWQPVAVTLLLIDCFIEHGINNSHGWYLCSRPLLAIYIYVVHITSIFLNIEITVSVFELLIYYIFQSLRILIE